MDATLRYFTGAARRSVLFFQYLLHIGTIKLMIADKIKDTTQDIDIMIFNCFSIKSMFLYSSVPKTDRAIASPIQGNISNNEVTMEAKNVFAIGLDLSFEMTGSAVFGDDAFAGC